MMEIKWIGCAPRNFRAGRPPHLEVEAVVIHIIDGSQSAADATFLNNSLDNPRSAHYSVGRDGVIHQYVREEDVAYHAGVIVRPSCALLEQKRTTAGYINPNYYTIGIEHDGKAGDDWSDAMYAASSGLLREISTRYRALGTLSRANVIMHRQIRADKSCPGFKVDLDRLIAAASVPVGDQALVSTVITTVAVNVRIGSPNRSATVNRTLAAGIEVQVVGTVQGEAVPDRDNHPVNRWYRTVSGEFIWSGAVKAG